MVKNKQKLNKSSRISRTILILASVLFITAILFCAIYFIRKSQEETEVQQSALINTNSQNSLDNPAVAEAKVVAEEYFEATKNCDLEKATSLRFLPNKTVKTKDECQSECSGGIQYKFIKPVSYKSAESGGITTEVTAFDYAVGCKDNTTPILLQMIRTSDDLRWQVFGTM